ncbi:MAG TPA: hypothetical protein VMT20_17405 [Terriglobia bacterium]|nr:hypothetical protein [Terriglobia bacterium]
MITSVTIFLPLGVATMSAAEPDARTLAIAFAVGAGFLATPISFVVLRGKPYIDQTRAY